MFDERNFDEKFVPGENRADEPQSGEPETERAYTPETDAGTYNAESFAQPEEKDIPETPAAHTETPEVHPETAVRHSEAAAIHPETPTAYPEAGAQQVPQAEPYPFAAETAINGEGVASRPGYPTGRDYEPVSPAAPQQPVEAQPQPMFSEPAPVFTAPQTFAGAPAQPSGAPENAYYRAPYAEDAYRPQQPRSYEQQRYEQPYYYADPNGAKPPKPPKKKRKALRRVIAALLVLAVLGGAVGTFAILYDVDTNDAGGITISRRGQNDGSAEVSPDPNEDTSIFVSPEPHSQETISPRPAGDGGPEMTINDSPVSQVDYGDTGKALTNQEIAAKCTPWTVGVIATTYYEYNYFGYGGASASTGTGIIMSSDGYIITNCHVVDGATDLSVRMLDGTEYEATLVGMDERSDLAVLKIDATGLPAAEFGDSDALLVGDPVIAIGNPLGLDLMGTVTNGIVSAINRDVVVDERTMTLIQTNAAINAGNSGGPLINQYGQVIGINTLKMQDYSTVVEGLGFAIPTNTAKAIVDELIEHGYVSGYPAIGVRCDNVSQSMSERYSIPIGVLVRYVHPDSNAYQAGLQVNDVIVEAQGQPVEKYTDLSAIVDQCSAGDEFELKVFHYNSRREETLRFVLNDENDLSDGSIIEGE